MKYNLKRGKNQAEESGSLTLYSACAGFGLGGLLMVLALMIYAAFPAAPEYSKAIAKSQTLEDFSKNELMRHAYALQDRVADDPQKLLVLYTKDLRLILARPDLDRKDYPSVVWQYRSQECVLDVFFTAADQEALSSAQANHYEMRPRALITDENGLEPVNETQCLQSLYDDRRKLVEAEFHEMFASATISQ